MPNNNAGVLVQTRFDSFCAFNIFGSAVCVMASMSSTNVAKTSCADRDRSRSPARNDKIIDLEVEPQPEMMLNDSQEPPRVFDPVIEHIIYKAICENQKAALRGKHMYQIDIAALRAKLESEVEDSPNALKEQ